MVKYKFTKYRRAVTLLGAMMRGRAARRAIRKAASLKRTVFKIKVISATGIAAGDSFWDQKTRSQVQTSDSFVLVNVTSLLDREGDEKQVRRAL
jgi:hypothetical protein